MASIKTERAVNSFDMRLRPYAQVEEEIEGFGLNDIYLAENPSGDTERVFKTGPTRAQTDVAPVDNPDDVFQVSRRALVADEELYVATENYLDPILQRNGKESFRFGTYLFNSTFVTVVATAITLLINAMAAFALSKYRFRGSTTVMLMIIATLMIPQAIILVSALSVLAILSIIWRWNDVPSSERGLSMVFQSYALYPHRGVRKNLTFGLENTRMTRAEMN